MEELITEFADKAEAKYVNNPITELNKKEHKALLDIPENLRPAHLAWMRCKTKNFPAKLTFIQGFEAARKIFEDK